MNVKSQNNMTLILKIIFFANNSTQIIHQMPFYIKIKYIQTYDIWVTLTAIATISKSDALLFE